MVPAARVARAHARAAGLAAVRAAGRVGGGDEVGRRPRARVRRARPAPARLQDRQGHQRHLPGPGRARPAAVAAGQALLDGEIVAFTDGRPDFEALQPRMHVSSADAAFRLSASIPVSYLAFDVLQADGVRLTRPAVPRAQENAQHHHLERSALARPAQFPRPRPGRGPGRVGRQRARGGGGQAARLGLRARRPAGELAQGQEPAPAGGGGGGLEAGPGQPDRAGRLAAGGGALRRRGRCSMRGTSGPGSPIRCCGC